MCGTQILQGRIRLFTVTQDICETPTTSLHSRDSQKDSNLIYLDLTSLSTNQYATTNFHTYFAGFEPKTSEVGASMLSTTPNNSPKIWR